MEKLSYSAHISNKKSAITSKTKLAGVAKHNLRKYYSSDYSDENIRLIYGTDNLMQDVKTVYKEQFDKALKEYNEKQTRPDRKIKNYFNYVSEKQQDMAVEIIFQIGDKEYWDKNRSKGMLWDIDIVYRIILDKLVELMPDFVVANAVIHYDEASPHMHVVGVPVGRGFKRGLSKKVSKRSVFTQETLSDILQGKLRETAEWSAEHVFHTELREKKKGNNHDLSVMEYKVQKESKKYLDILESVKEQEFFNEELQNLAKEMQKQTDELQQKREILQLKNEELQMKAEELQEETNMLHREKKTAMEEVEKTNEMLQEIRAIATLGEKEVATLGNEINYGLLEPSGLMSAKAYKEKIVKPFLAKIWQMVNLIIERARSCFVELKKVQGELDNLKWENKQLKDKNDYIKELYEQTDRENDRLREDSRELECFREYLPAEAYKQIVEHGKRGQYERKR